MKNNELNLWMIYIEHSIKVKHLFSVGAKDMKFTKQCLVDWFDQKVFFVRKNTATLTKKRLFKLEGGIINCNDGIRRMLSYITKKSMIKKLLFNP